MALIKANVIGKDVLEPLQKRGISTNCLALGAWRSDILMRRRIDLDSGLRAEASERGFAVFMPQQDQWKTLA